MRITLKGFSVEIPDADQDGQHEFPLTDRFWDLWQKNSGLCKVFGFYIERQSNNWVGVYRPFAKYAEGSKRLRREDND